MWMLDFQIMKKYLVSILLCLSFTSLASSLEDNYNAAQAAYEKGDFNKAGDLFAKVAKELEKSDKQQAALFWGNAGIAKRDAKNYQDAISFFEKTVNLGKKLPVDQVTPFYQELVINYGNLGQSANQIDAIDRLLKKVNPKGNDLALVEASRGDAYRKLELYASAVSSYKKALGKASKDYPNESKALLLTALGLSQIQVGDLTDAEKNLKQSVEIATKANKPLTIAESLSNLGVLQWQKGNYEDAEKSLNKALEVEKKAKLLRNEGVDTNNLGLVKKAQGNNKLAMELFNKSLEIANKVENKRDAGIAIVNQALLYRITGDYDSAEFKYNKAIQIFTDIGFKEGLAGTYLGIAKMIDLEGKDDQKALENYNKALNLYKEINQKRGQAETLIAMGAMYKRQADPVRATRDLVFDSEDEEEPKAQNTDDALKNLKEVSSKAMDIATNLNSKEFLWSCHQLLGFADYKENKLEDSFRHYQTAIDIVTKLFTDASAVEMMGEYMAGKEDLYSEAQGVCSALYEKTKDPKYNELMIVYSDTYRNEIQKASASLSNIKFKDKAKQDLYNKLSQLGKSQKLASASLPVVKELPKNATAEEKNAYKLAQKELKEQKELVKKLEGDYDKIFAEWKKKYPGDAVMFESGSRVNVKEIQKLVADDQAVVQYTALPEKLLISFIDNKKISCVSVDVKLSKLNEIYKKEFTENYILTYGRGDLRPCGGDDNKCLAAAIKPLTEFYDYLIRPIEDELKDKKRLYFIADGVLSSVPFSALVSSVDKDGVPTYMVESYDIAYLRPSFVKSFLTNEKPNGSFRKILALGNTYNANFRMAMLPGTIGEINSAIAVLANKAEEKDIAIEERLPDQTKQEGTYNFQYKFGAKPYNEAEMKDKYAHLTYPLQRPTESWLRSKLDKSNYEIVYFATHGMPTSNWIGSYKQINKIYKKHKNDPKKEAGNQYVERMFSLFDSRLNMSNPLSGFMYLSSDADHFDPNASIPATEADGFLTMKEILEMPDSIWSKTKMVVVSACNTGVTFNPDAVVSDDAENQFNIKETNEELKKLGLLPGVDQVSFVDSFMRRGVRNVYGTFWFADDAASSYLMSSCMSNISKQKDMDPIAAFSDAQREFIAKAKKNSPIPGVNGGIHPFYWAVGGMFGK